LRAGLNGVLDIFFICVALILKGIYISQYLSTFFSNTSHVYWKDLSYVHGI
jgi:hypothetical protein